MHQPLAERMRPRSFGDFAGQQHLVSPNAPLRRLIEKDRVPSFILWGPPGTGKTSLARVIANQTNRDFITLSAVAAGVKDIKEAVAQAQKNQGLFKKETILFVDEVHRFNKGQQDVLLPYIEDGTITFIGATTENPSFELNSALLSRAPVFILKPIEKEDLRSILEHALKELNQTLPADRIDILASLANGDARLGLNLLERLLDFLENNSIETLDDATFEQALGTRQLRYDATGEQHYDTISAFIKSMRDSDPDAALYYLARMLESGEDPLFIARRMVIFASEDIGNADPRGLQVALSVRDAVDFVGMPEARINLAQGVTYLASAPKSNASYVGIDDAIAQVRESGNLEIPMHIRNAPTGLMKKLGYGKGYKYAHNQPEGSGLMQNLPEKLQGKVFYDPKDSGLEKQIREKIDGLRKRRNLSAPKNGTPS